MNIHRSAHVHDTKRKQRKEATTRSGATAPTKCDTQKGSKKKSPFSVVLKTYHLTGIRHKTCLKHSNFLNRTLCPIVTNMEHHGNSKGTGNRRKHKIRQNELRPGTKHANYIMHPRLIGRDPELRPFLQISGFHFTHGTWSARKQNDCCIEPNCYEWNAWQHKMRKHGK